MVGDRLKNFRKSVTDNVTRQALVAPQSVTGAGVTDPRLVAGAVTDSRLVANAPVTMTSGTSGNIPSFLQAGNTTMSNQGDMLDMISEILGLSQPDPRLVKAQTAQAEQDANRLFLQNQDAIKQREAQAQMTYLQRQMKDAAQYTTGSVGQILTQRYADQAKVLRDQGELNWLNMPDSYFSVPQRRGWTGPAMPGTWGL